MKVQLKQHDPFDCGAVCLASICAYYQLQIPIARVRQYANTDKKGTNILGLVEAAKKLGFNAKGVRGTFENLSELPLPAIAHIKAQGKFPHFVVIFSVSRKYVKVMDPDIGKLINYRHEDFIKDWTGVLVLLNPNSEFRSGSLATSKKVLFGRLLKPHSSIIIQVIIGAFLYTLLGIFSSVYIQKITDFVIPNFNGNLLNVLSLFMLFVIAVQVVVGLIRSVFTVKLGQVLDLKLILGYYTHLLDLPQRFFDNMRVGEIISRINDAVKIRAFINEISVSILVNISIVFFSFTMMFIYNWKLAFIMTLSIPFYVLIYFITNHVNKKNIRELMESSAELESQLVESINSIETIKRFGLETYSNEKTADKFINVLKSVYKVGISNIQIGAVGDLLTKSVTVVLFWTGTNYIFKGQLTPGELFSFFALVGYFTGPLVSLVNVNRSVQEALIASDRLFEIMDLEHEEDRSKKTIVLSPSMAGDIKFEKVYFRYGTRAKIFEDFSLTILKGQVTSIVGVSGSGKSTLINLMQDLYPVNEGHIYLGDYDIKYISNKSLRSFISVVPQNINLFAGNVIENITIGFIDPDVERVVSICKKLGMMEFIENMPDGLFTYIGENGSTLSGGQRQRIAIARALYRNSEILILDEATSSLDTFSDSYVQQAIEEMRMNNKTVIIITHKLSSVVHSDQIIVLKEGKVVEEGTHANLLAGKGYYYELSQKNE